MSIEIYLDGIMATVELWEISAHAVRCGARMCWVQPGDEPDVVDVFVSSLICSRVEFESAVSRALGVMWAARFVYGSRISIGAER